MSEDPQPIKPRQQQINDMQVGMSISLAQRLEMSGGGMTRGAINRVTELLRGTLDQQAARARKFTGFEYTVENGSFITNSDAIVIVVVITRTR